MAEGDTSEPKADRRVRADAQRSIDALLATALAVFTAEGVDAPVRKIADRAGVGIGTLYRHFPTRADLIAAVFRREMDAVAAAAPALAAEYQPFEALSKWIDRYVAFVGTKRGLAAALHSGDPAYAALPAYREQRIVPAFRSLLDAAIAAGEVRADVDADDLLHVVSSVSASVRGEGPERARRMVALLIDGLRYGAAAPRAGVPATGA